jgi:hypothetical protein
LLAKEAVLISALESPTKLFDITDGELQIRRDLVIAVDDGETDEELRQVQGVLSDLWRSATPVSIVSDCVPVTFYLDPPALPDWQPIAKTAGGRRIAYLGAGVGCEPSSSAA